MKVYSFLSSEGGVSGGWWRARGEAWPLPSILGPQDHSWKSMERGGWVGFGAGFVAKVRPSKLEFKTADHPNPWPSPMLFVRADGAKLPVQTRHHRTKPKHSPLGIASSLGWALLFLQNRLLATPHSKNTPQNTLQPHTKHAKPLNLLCMDGGGMRGRNLMVCVEELENAIGKPIAQSFDLVAGTSIGGCGALFLHHYPQNGQAIAKARRAMYELQHTCFAATSRRRLVVAGHFCTDARRDFMLRLCGDIPITAKKGGPHAFALSSRRTRKGLEPFLLRTYRHNRPFEKSRPAICPGTSSLRLWQAVEATSAAPFMFPRARIGRKVLVDGGMVANDPTLIAIEEAAALWPDRPIGLVVSLGTGEAKSERETRRLQAVAREICKRSRTATYVRFNPVLREYIWPIETSEEKLRSMEEDCRAQFAASGAIGRCVEALKRSSRGRTSEEAGSASSEQNGALFFATMIPS